MSTNERFFRQDYIPLLKKLSGQEKGQWGVLSAQGMVEHMCDSFGIARGRIQQGLQTPEALLPKFREFAMSEKAFKPGTKNGFMSETPAPLRNSTMVAAIEELEQEIEAFIHHYHAHPGSAVTNPFFGDLNYEEQLHLLQKHAVHHLRQFNLMD